METLEKWCEICSNLKIKKPERRHFFANSPRIFWEFDNFAGLALKE